MTDHDDDREPPPLHLHAPPERREPSPDRGTVALPPSNRRTFEPARPHVQAHVLRCATCGARLTLFVASQEARRIELAAAGWAVTRTPRPDGTSSTRLQCRKCRGGAR